MGFIIIFLCAIPLIGFGVYSAFIGEIALALITGITGIINLICGIILVCEE